MTKETWDLSDLFSGMDDPRVEATLSEQLRRAEDFAARYRGQIDNPDLAPEALCTAIREYESILQEADKPVGYASLLFAADTGDPERGAFMQRMMESSTQISVRLMFFDLELMAIPAEQAEALLRDPALAHYAYYIRSSRLFRDYRLTEPEERVMEEKANTGRRAFSRLFEEIVSDISFTVRGETKNLPEVIALLREPDRELRRDAAEAFSAGLVENARTITFIFNTLLQEKGTDDRLRDLRYPEQSRHLANQLDKETVDLVVSTAVERYGLVERYYRLKSEILGYELTHYDRYAPLFDSKERVPYERGREIVLSAFGAFDPLLSETAGKFFEHRWIDAEVRKGKRGGAFCSYVTPDLHPYVFVNYLERMDDVMTLGHELGHGVHAYLAREQGYLNFSSVLPLAELASTFGEMLVFEALQEKCGDDERLALYAEKIEGAFATIFRQAAMFRFEQAIHERRKSGELTTEEYNAIWQSEIQAMFGDSVKLGEEHRYWWLYVSHFVASPFYVYAYTFGELLVMALYAMYKREGAAFPAKYIELLRAGGSMSPKEMLGRVGIDISDPAFWRGGVEVLEGFVDHFEGLYRSR
ncbi:MAG: M3 family oligoendopeptidase [Armatimonadota bacterium]